MECIRLGSQIPGSCHGCCAFSIFQEFDCDPEAPAAKQLVHGDMGSAVTAGGEQMYAGKTNLELFKTHLRINSFSDRDMDNHGFIAVLTTSQTQGIYGKKWLKILKEHGFEYFRSQDNGVYGYQRPPVHMFILFRNIGLQRTDVFKPPKEWTDLPSVVPEATLMLSDKQKKEIMDKQTAFHAKWWGKTETRLYTAQELADAGVTSYMAAGTKGKLPSSVRFTFVEKKAPAAKQSPFPSLQNSESPPQGEVAESITA